MSSLWDVPQYLIMAFSLAFPTPDGKASRVSLTPAVHHAAASAKAGARAGLPSDEVWLRAVKAASTRSDILNIYGARIFMTSSGRYYVPEQADRAEILSLKSNPDVALRVLAAATRTLEDDIARHTGARPTRGALLVAHVLGREAGLRYARALLHEPNAKAASAVPALSAATDGDVDLTLEALEARLVRALRAGETQLAANGADDASESGLKGTLTKADPKASSALADAR